MNSSDSGRLGGEDDRNSQKKNSLEKEEEKGWEGASKINPLYPEEDKLQALLMEAVKKAELEEAEHLQARLEQNKTKNKWIFSPRVSCKIR